MICIIPIGAECAVGADESVTVHILQEGCVLGIDGVHYCGIAPASRRYSTIALLPSRTATASGDSGAPSSALTSDGLSFISLFTKA